VFLSIIHIFILLLISIPDAKVLLPTQDIIPLAIKSSDVSATGVFTLLCSDDDLNMFKLVCKAKEKTNKK